MFPPTPFPYHPKCLSEAQIWRLLAIEDYPSHLSLGIELHTCAPVLHPPPPLPSHILHSIAARKEQGGAL